MVFRADWTLPCRTRVISLMAQGSAEDHQISFVHHHAHLPLLCQGHFRQDLRLGGVMDPDQLAAPVKILGVGRTAQRHHLAWLNTCESLRTHACGPNDIGFYSHVWVTKTPQIKMLYCWTLKSLDWSCAISYNTSKLAETYVFHMTNWCHPLSVYKEAFEAKEELKVNKERDTPTPHSIILCVKMGAYALKLNTFLEIHK